jgi:hypothetical protein
VISLDYNDEPAVNVYCPREAPACSSNFRRMRIYGDGISIDHSFDNSGAESIVNRLVKLLMYLDREDPQQGWGSYLDNGMPSWNRIGSLSLGNRRVPAWPLMWPRGTRWHA